MDRTATGLAPLVEGLQQAHLVGLDERGMTGLARMLVQRGYRVTGSISDPASNRAVDRLRGLGVSVHAGHSPSSVPRSAHFLVYGPDVSKEHPDRLSAARAGVEQRSSPSVLAGLLRRGVGIAATGGRKAGLAAAMIAWTLTHSGLDPTVVLSSIDPKIGGSGRLGRGLHTVVEGRDIAPTEDFDGIAVLLLHDDSGPIERDAGLRGWAEAASPGTYVLGFADEADRVEPWPLARADIERFSLAPGHAWWGADVRQDRGCYRFRAFHRGRFVVEIRLHVPGKHHVLGALAAVAACHRIDLPGRAIREALAEFGGISRGFESRGSYRGVTLVDDEAEGPGGVGDALEVARDVFGPRRRLCAAYRHRGDVETPWPASSEFSRADRVWIIDEGGTAGDSMARALSASGVVVGRASGLDGAIRELDRHLEPGDVLVTLGAGEVGTIADAFLRRLSSDRHS